VGISTGKAVGSDGLNQDSIKGKLTLDSDKLTTALQSDLPRVRSLLAGTGAAGGFGQAFESLLDPAIRAGGTIDQRVDSQSAQRKRLADQLATMDTRLKQKQDLLKRQFAAMESALQSSQSQGQWLQGQLNSLNSNR
jgi:flagellar hook-associated protein 2